MGPVLVFLPWILLHLGLARATFILEGGSSVSFAKFPKWNPCVNGSLVLEFSTMRPDGLLLYTDDGGRYEFFELKLVAGVGWLRFNLGGERVTLFKAGQDLNSGEWHKAEIRRDGAVTTFSVDGVEQSETTEGDDLLFGTLEDNSHVYVGGMPHEFMEDLRSLALPSAVFEPHYGGKIRGLQYSDCGGEWHDVEMLDSRGVRETDMDYCASVDPCLNGGVCYSTDLGSQCDCSHTGYSGQICQTERVPLEVTLSGHQFVHYDLSSRGDSIVSNNDEIKLQFRTRQSTGLLFYTGDGVDYLTVSLSEGVVRVGINLGSGRFNTHVKPMQEDIRFDDNSWHTVLVSRRSREVVVNVDGLYQETGTTVGEFTMLSSQQLYLGGATNVSALPGTSDFISNFRGCLQEVLYTADTVKLPLLDLMEQNSSLLTVHGHPQLDGCHDDATSQPITFLTEDSVLHLPNWRLTSDSSIHITIRTNEPDGLMMYSVTPDRSKFFALELLDGFLYLVLNLGSGTLRIKASERPLTDGLPHAIAVRTHTRKGEILIDGKEEKKFRISPANKWWEVAGILHIGGVSDTASSQPLPQQIWAGMLKHGYVGCMQDLSWGGAKVDIAGLARDQRAVGVALYCRASQSQCRKHPCRHRGVCRDGWNRVSCDCLDTGYAGRTCNGVATTLKFEGSQYMRVTLPEESRTEVEDISLRFRTKQASGLLLTTRAWGSLDQLQLKLVAGQVQLHIQLPETNKSMLAGTSLGDNVWHSVRVKRRGQTLELRVDNGSLVTEDLLDSDPTLHMNEVHIGAELSSSLHDKVGSKMDAMDLHAIHTARDIQKDSDSTQPVDSPDNFVGLMQQLNFNGNLFFEMARTGRINNVETNAKIQKRDKVINFPISFKSPEAFLITRLKLYSTFSIDFLVRTTQPDGLLIYSGGSKGKDFMAVELVGGHLRYIFNVGSGPRVVRAHHKPINDNMWHDIAIIRPTLTEHIIRVDDAYKMDNLPDSRNIHFDTSDDFYIGGVKKHMYDNLPKQVKSREGFQGCMASVDLGGERGNLLKHRKSEVPDHFKDEVVSGCEGPSMKCEPSSCKNRGSCVQQWTSYTCDCDMTSFTGPACEEEGASYTFGEAGGTITYTYPPSEREDTAQDELALGFITTKKDAVLVRVESTDFGDYIEMEMVKGNLFVVYNMGSVDHPLGEVYNRMDDGQYHVVRFTRDGPNSTVQVDDLDVQPKFPPGEQLSVFNGQAMVIIGGRPDKNGNLIRPFEGTIAGLVFNKVPVLEAASRGDPKVTISGDVKMDLSPLPIGVTPVPPTRPVIVTPVSGDSATSSMQSTMGVKTTPRGEGVADDLIFSGSGCHGDDEADCSHLAGTARDEIIRPVLTVKTTTVAPTTTSVAAPDSGETGSGTDCDDEEDCELGSGMASVGPMSNPKTTTDDIIILSSTEASKIGKQPPGGANAVPPEEEESSVEFVSYNHTVNPPKKTPNPITVTPRIKAGDNPTSQGKGKGDGKGSSSNRNGSYGDTYEKRSKSPMGLNIGLIVGIAAGVVLLLLILAYALYKYKSRDEGSYKIDESKNYSYEAYTAQAAKQPVTPHVNGGMSKTSSHSSKAKKKDVKEWYV